MAPTRRRRPEKDPGFLAVDGSGLLIALMLVAVGYGCAWLHLMAPLVVDTVVAAVILGLSVTIFRPSDDE